MIFIKKYVKNLCVFIYCQLRTLVAQPRIFANSICDRIFLVKTLNGKMKCKQVTILPENNVVLVLAPHIDDEILGVGGIIKKHIDAGDKVKIVYVTDGRRSSSRRYSPDEMATVRRDEGIRISEMLGCSCVFFDAISMEWKPLDYMHRVTELIAADNPSIIYTVNPIDVNADHYLTTKCLLFALEEANYSGKLRMYQVQSVLPTKMWESFVDISDVIRTKKDCIKVFDSQMGMKKSFQKVILLNRYCAKALAEGKYVEIFWEITMEQLRMMLIAAEKHNRKAEAIVLVSGKNSIRNAIIAADKMEMEHEW